MTAALTLKTPDDRRPVAKYFGWVPVRCELRGVGDPGGQVTVTQESSARSGRLLFGTADATEPELRLRVAADDEPTQFMVAGEFGRASSRDGDVKIVVRDSQSRVIARFPVMVRVRKNLNHLTTHERDRVLRALAALNDQGRGVFAAFRASHNLASVEQAHGNAAFLPWHRAFLLDLERELQRVDPSVALPYWRFDLPATRVFRADAIGGVERDTESARFAPSNPLSRWMTDGAQGIERRPNFDTRSQPALGTPGRPLIPEDQVVRHTGPFRKLPAPFEANPHGSAHTSFSGYLQSLESAARDPLFYLLHCNVDRLWAKWQWLRGRRNPADPDAFGYEDDTGTELSEGSRPKGHNLVDTMWPWDGDIVAPRPAAAPRQPFATDTGVTAPGPRPTVRAMIDYQGVHDSSARLGFDYDDVPFQP